MERPAIVSGTDLALGLLSLLHGEFFRNGDISIDDRLITPDAGQGLAGQLHRRNLAGLNLWGELADGHGSTPRSGRKVIAGSMLLRSRSRARRAPAHSASKTGERVSNCAWGMFNPSACAMFFHMPFTVSSPCMRFHNDYLTFETS